MCGIAGYNGPDESSKWLDVALKAMSHRGYDSWGAVAAKDHKVSVTRCLGDYSNSTVELPKGNLGIAHTRWATHGEVSIENCHPIQCGLVYTVHNGQLKTTPKVRTKKVTGTDTEYLSIFISELIEGGLQYFEAIDHVCSTILSGATAIMIEGDPRLFLYRTPDQPLYYGVGGKVASDVHAFTSQDEVFRLQSGVLYRVLDDGTILPKPSESHRVDVASSIAEVKVTKHYMLDEILSQEKLLKRSSRRVSVLGRTRFIGCGSSYYAAMVAAKYYQQYGFDVTAEYATQFEVIAKKHRNIFISQSGETKDVIDAYRKAQKGWVTNELLTNNPNSTLGDMFPDDRIMCIEAGKEVGVAATKTFSLTVASLIGINEKDLEGVRNGVVAVNDTSFNLYLVNEIARYPHILVLGAGPYYPLALETALKLKEVSYIHAEALPANEMKHGPIALIDKDVLTIVLKDSSQPDVDLNISQIKARGGTVIVFEYNWWSCMVQMQTLSYLLAIHKGHNPDMPKNLAKAVTV